MSVINKVYETNGPEETREDRPHAGRICRPGPGLCPGRRSGSRQNGLPKGFAEGLGIEEPVNSPTFTILQIYEEGRLPLYHFDVYRIEEPEEMEEIGLDEYIDGDGVCLIEWAGRIEELLPEDVIVVFIEKDLEKGLDYRRIMFASVE